MKVMNVIHRDKDTAGLILLGYITSVASTALAVAPVQRDINLVRAYYNTTIHEYTLILHITCNTVH